MSQITSIVAWVQLPSPLPLLILIIYYLKTFTYVLVYFHTTLDRIGRQYYYLTFADEDTEIWARQECGSRGNSFLIEKVWLPKPGALPLTIHLFWIHSTFYKSTRVLMHQHRYTGTNYKMSKEYLQGTLQNDGSKRHWMQQKLVWYHIHSIQWEHKE